MDPEEFSIYRHEAVHELMRLNTLCEQQFHISSWPRWDYASISGKTWLWSWAANESKKIREWLLPSERGATSLRFRPCDSLRPGESHQSSSQTIVHRNLNLSARESHFALTPVFHQYTAGDLSVNSG